MLPSWPAFGGTIVTLGLGRTAPRGDVARFAESGWRWGLNVTRGVYEIRDGTGVGVGAPQYGPRRGVFVGVTKTL